MKENFTPILSVPAVPKENAIRFLHMKSQIDIDGSDANMVWEILSYCNGYNNLIAISKLSGIPLDIVDEVITELFDLELLVDSKEQFMHFHRISSYPTPFAQDLSQDEIHDLTVSKRKPTKEGAIFEFRDLNPTPLTQLIEGRHSCRNFSDKKMSLTQVGNICRYAYSINKHAVPSGGALYPLKLYVLVEKTQNNLPIGYYEYDPEKDILILFNEDVDCEQLKYCFNQEKIPFNSSVQIVIAADLHRQANKYANRGYRLTLIEVGHVAENISLYCEENGLSTCEMGGVQDEPLMRELGIFNDEIYPIIAMPIGYSAKEEPTLNKVRYMEENTGNNKPVSRVYVSTFGENGPFFGATSTYIDGNKKIQYAGATSVSYDDAVFKATIEGIERWCSGQVRTDYFGPANKLVRWMNPYRLFPLSKEQAEKYGVSVFTDDLPISWTIGKDSSGNDIFLPSDIIYYGQKDAKNQIYFGHSSGIAAYSNFAEAEKRALTELIERDAMMRSWYTRESPKVLSEKNLSIHVKKRIQHWKKEGRKLYVLELPSDYGRVIEVVITGNEFPFFVAGAAATIIATSTEDTVLKALQEAEYNLCLMLGNNDAEHNITPDTVSSPTDHGVLYATEEYAKKLQWLYSGEEIDSFTDLHWRTVEELKNILDTITVDLTLPNMSLYVVRVFSPKLVQINFGSNSAHYAYPFLVDKVRPESLELPHYFA